MNECCGKWFIAVARQWRWTACSIGASVGSN